MQRLLRLTSKTEKVIVGLISGTSVDGIDAALTKVKGSGLQSQIELLAFHTLPYPREIRAHVLAASQPGQGTVDQICRLNAVVGECFAQAALAVIDAGNLQPEAVDLIGSHGQTIHHLPQAGPWAGVPSRGTLQIGEPSVIAKRTGIITIADFRPADVALGGQGAPLVPLMDFLLFRSPAKTRGVLNLGGIANLTLLKRNCAAHEVIAFDTGPANMVIDGLMQKLYGRTFDEQGKVAARGRVSSQLLQQLLQHPYFTRALPKSTGREEFGEAFVAHVVKIGSELGLSHEDLVATATALTAETVRQGAHLLHDSHGAMEELIVSGGGVYNPVLMGMLRGKFSPATISTTDDHGLPGDAKEAMLFALLANETVSGNPGNLPSVTGARAATILGKICL